MSEEKSIQTYAGVAYESGAKKLGDTVVNRALDFVVKNVTKQFRRGTIRIGTAFSRYLDNAFNRINQVKTLATGNDPRNIIGDNELYVKIGVEYKKTEIDTTYVENLTNISNHILILGTGGVGKSMLSRYLFLRTALDGGCIPVYVELRKISQQSAGNLSVITLVKDCMKQFDVDLPEEEFIYSLRLGKYLFLLDGFDEVREELALEAAEKIQEFCAKYPSNKCIMTSRQTLNYTPMETFVPMNSLPLRKEQAIELASKIWAKDEKTAEFCKQLDEELFAKHQSFAQNPLLLSMMFLTFMRNLSIPDHLADFYKKAYEALYSQHDNHDKGVYRRDFQCASLDEGQFRLLFARFCFQTYYHEQYEFEQKNILKWIKDSADFLGYEIAEEDYLADLKKAVCMMVEDGNIYKFSHRSFQAYFAAIYTSEILTDKQQKRLFQDVLGRRGFDYEDCYDLLHQIEPDRFTKNALEDGLRELQRKADNSPEPDMYLLKQVYYAMAVFDDTKLGFAVKDRYTDRLFLSFKRYIVNRRSFRRFGDEQKVISIIKKIGNELRPEMSEESLRKVYFNEDYQDVEFHELDKSDAVSEEEKKEFYDTLIECTGIHFIRTKIREWLQKLDREKEALRDDDYISSL